MKPQAKSFEFSGYKLSDNSQIELHYAIYFENETKQDFKEIVTLSEKYSEITAEKQKVLDRLLKMLHFMCGLSYWKLYCPAKIIIKSTTITQDEATFWNTVYTKGLGEFFYRNKIDFRGKVTFPSEAIDAEPSLPLGLPERALIGVGGGKDSLVTFELLKEAKIPLKAFLLETQKEYQLINSVLEVMEIGAIKVQRKIDPKLFESNSIEGAFNGHIPITAIYSTIGLLCAVLYDYSYIIMSNEGSANYGNVTYLGEEVNHQWSKSAEFELLISSYIHNYITPSLHYFSLLRPWSELRIVQEFVKHSKYFEVFSSCNNNFKVSKAGLQTQRWCGICPKCAFVFALLAAFLTKSEVINIFGKNMYSDETMLLLFKELLGVENVKPFECVGTPDEVKGAFYLALKKGEFKDDVIMKMYESTVLPHINNPEEMIHNVLTESDMSLIPNTFKNLIQNP